MAKHGGRNALSTTLRLGPLALGLLVLANCAEVEVGAEAVKAINSKAVGPDPQTANVYEAAAGSRINPKLVSAPAVFEARGNTIWDGNRTLQGIWVAHPKAETAMRVRVINLTTGVAVDGALFRREASIAGPPVLMSSEAAEALEIVPNRATPLLITALKPAPEAIQLASVETEVEPEGDVEATDVLEEPTETSTEAEAGTEATAEAAEAATEGEQSPEAPVEAVTETTTEPTELAVAATDPEPIVEAVTEPEVVEEPAEETVETDFTWESETQDQTSTQTAEISTGSETEATPVVTAAASPEAVEPEPEAERSFATVTVESPAEPTQPSQPTIDSLPEPGSTQPQEVASIAPTVPEPEPDPAVEPEPEPEPAATPVPEPRPLELGTIDPELPADLAPTTLFVRAGTFSVRENADRLVTRIRAAGYPAQGRNFSSQGRELTTVTAGPFKTRRDQERALKDIRAMGLTDAFASQ
ncbi:MAG: SPOR domain-containing protein [Pseudomonadota bacterium]